MKVVAKSNLQQMLETIASQMSVMAPVSRDGIVKFFLWSKGDEVNLEKNALIPPKNLLLPQSEKMYKYKTDKLTATVEEVPPLGKKQVIFGIRPCDAQSIHLLDMVFLTKGYEDSYYKDKRENSILVALACNAPEPTCFCQPMGIDPCRAENADVMMYDLGDRLAFEAQSEKGRELLELGSGQLQDDPVELPVQDYQFQLQVKLDGVTEKLQQMFEHPMWAEVCRKCIGCGTCTYLCPTCYCFDINSKNRGQEGFKFRCWDSCMFSEYTRMAGGHNPRPSKKERMRNRFLHKLQYFPERYHEVACVGCGRCLQKCPVNVDITRLIEQVREVSLDV